MTVDASWNGPEPPAPRLPCLLRRALKALATRVRRFGHHVWSAATALGFAQLGVVPPAPVPAPAPAPAVDSHCPASRTAGAASRVPSGRHPERVPAQIHLSWDEVMWLLELGDIHDR